MTASLDEKKLLARVIAERDRHVIGYPGPRREVAELLDQVSTYLAASPSPSMEMGVVAWRGRCEPAEQFGYAWEYTGRDPTPYDVFDTIDPLVTLSSAQSALAAMRAERDEMTEATNSYAHQAAKLAIEVQRLTEENEALKGSHDELLKLAADLGEPDDPFAAWEALVALKVRIKALEEVLRPFADGALDVSGSAIILGHPEAKAALNSARAALKENAL